MLEIRVASTLLGEHARAGHPLHAKETHMKTTADTLRTNRAHRPEPSPSKGPMGDRPDNGSLSSRGSGPSSGSRRDNPHRRIQLTGHARAH